MKYRTVTVAVMAATSASLAASYLSRDHGILPGIAAGAGIGMLVALVVHWVMRLGGER